MTKGEHHCHNSLLPPPLCLSLFTSKLDILLPSYIKSASESVHQLYRASPEAQNYLDYFEELAHPTIHFIQYIMSRNLKSQSSFSRGTSEHVLHIRATQRLATSFSLRMSTTTSTSTARSGRPTSMQHFRLATLTSTRTSIYVSRLQMRSTSTSHLLYFSELMTRLKEIGKKDYLYLVAILIKVDEARTRNLLHPSRRESSQHQEFELNQPTSTPPLHIHSIGHQLITIKGPTGQNTFDKVNSQAISSSHLFDQTSISGPLNSNSHSLISLRNHETIWSKVHRHIATYFPHMLHREVAGGSHIYIEDDWKDIQLWYVYTDHQHHALQRSDHHHQVQRRHGHRLTSEAHQDLSEPVSSTSLTSDEPQRQRTSAEYIRRDTS